MAEDSNEKQDLTYMVDAAILKYLSHKVAINDDMEKCDRYDRTIESFSPCDCKISFEFKKLDLLRLMQIR